MDPTWCCVSCGAGVGEGGTVGGGCVAGAGADPIADHTMDLSDAMESEPEVEVHPLDVAERSSLLDALDEAEEAPFDGGGEGFGLGFGEESFMDAGEL